MSVRAACGLGFVVVGVALASGGFPIFAAVAAWTWEFLPLLILVAAGLLLVVAVVPASRLFTAGILVAIGLGIHAVRTYDVDSGEVARYGGAAVVIAVGVLMSVDRERSQRVEFGRRRRWAVGVRTFRLSTAPARIRFGVVLGKGTLDFPDGATYQNAVVELFLSVWGGRAIVEIPAGWSIVGGRVDAAILMGFRGQLDSPDEFTDPTDGRQRAALVALATETGSPVVVVVHVLGAGGGVEVRSRS